MTLPSKTQAASAAQPFILQGSERFGKSGSPHPVYYPGDAVTLVGEAYFADDLHLELIEKTALQGFQNFRKTTVSQRAAILNNLADRLEAHQEALSLLITRESGKPLTLSQREVARSVKVCRGYAAQVERTTATLMQVDGCTVRLSRFPIGPVLAITPFNFPLNLVIHKLAPAIAAGCSITIKPAPQTPLTALYLGRLAAEAGYEAISIIPAQNSLAETLVRSSAFAKLSFTGSAPVGWHLRSIAGNKSVTLELGGNAAVIVEELSEPVESLAQRIALGAFSFAGQICISVQRILIQDALKAALLPALVNATRQLKVGDPFKLDTDIGPMISIQQVQRTRSLIKDALKAGANVIYGGNTFNAFTMNPTLLDRTTAEMAINAEEVFAPIATVSTYSTLDEALNLVNQSRYGLQAGLYTHNPAKIELAYQQLEVGGLLINDIPTTRLDLLPYGGVKDSGLGREGVLCGIEEYTYLKSLIQK
ncbi:succinate-semialdehyde dehydrogenase [NADP(+)] [Microcystis phage MaAM05]|nr:succinate-semialdehyde dehydrogenase [NADP(+)] [Microcystis phage MaAM05]